MLEYKYTDNFYDPWDEIIPRVRSYSRSKVKQELKEQVDEYVNARPFDDEDMTTLMDIWLDERNILR